jgi:hypothetical protein
MARAITARRASRPQSVEYGRLDYVPELNKSAARYGDALKQITDEMGRTTEVFDRNRELVSQEQAQESAAAASQLCETYERSIPIISESGTVLRECIRGALKSEQPATVADIEAIRTLRGQTREARLSTAGYLRSLRGGKKTAAWLRRKNFSRSLNEAASRLQEQQHVAARTIHRIVRGLRAAERQMWRRLVWYSAVSRWPHFIPRPPFVPQIGRDGEPVSEPHDD